MSIIKLCGLGVISVAAALIVKKLKPDFAVFVSLAAPGETFVRELHVGNRRTRSYIRRVSGNYIFDMMRRYMLGLPVIPE